ncbi:MAG TPA: phage major capsid protein [Candidatus Limnocylindrales bacterium]|nr:phage major capsid protein [Candidatus Limnocylindrales bacterium]
MLRGKVRITSATQEGRDAIGLVEGDILTKASVGYEIHKVIERTTSKSGGPIERTIDGATFRRALESRGVTRVGDRGDGDVQAFRRDLDAAAGPLDRAADDVPVYEVVDWEPFEDSLVTVPADNTVGVGRSHAAAPVTTTVQTPGGSTVQITEGGAQPPAATEQERAASAPPATAASVTKVTTPAVPATHQEKATMAEAQAAAGAAETRHDPLEVEKNRKAAIGNMCRASKIDPRVEDQWVRDGATLEEVAEKILKVMEERGKERPTAASDLGLTRAETQRFSLFRAIRAMRTPTQENINLAAYELECSRTLAKRLQREDSNSIFIPGEVLQRPLGEAAQRAMSTTPGSKGGFMVNVENMGFIDILRNRSVTMRMGARRLPGLVGNVTIPRQTGKGTVTWQGGEGTSVTATDQALGQLSMTPKTAIAITDASEQLLRQATPSAEAFIMADLAADIAIDGVDYVAINGTGGAQPLGIKNTTGITSGQDAASATYAKLLAFVSTAGASNAIRGNPGFVTNTAGAAKLMTVQRFSGTDTPVWEGNMLDGTLCGFNAMSSEQLASGNLIFGSWDEVVIGEWGVLELAMDNGGTRFNQAQVGIRAMWMVDVLVRYPQAFVVSTNLS